MAISKIEFVKNILRSVTHDTNNRGDFLRLDKFYDFLKKFQRSNGRPILTLKEFQVLCAIYGIKLINIDGVQYLDGKKLTKYEETDILDGIEDNSY